MLHVIPVMDDSSNLAHGFDTEYAFEGQVRLELKRSSKIVG